MSKVYAFLADGLEEIECLAVVDILRRAGIECETVSITGETQISGSHNIRIITDKCWKEIEIHEDDVMFLPGGMPGTKYLGEFTPLCDALKKHAAVGGRMAAICAAPSVLGDLGLLNGKKATCYPGFEEHLTGATYVSDGVVTDGNVTTARGMGYAIDLGLELVKHINSEEQANELKAAIQHNAL
ncbi:MAG: DJ-1/PfpI family protein [Lachnospiraceae bacterium]|nr:DJ-1/PfpI family protein [Lachnospiraceae bacterium]